MNDRWQDWIDRLKSDNLDEEELAAFRRELENDPGHRDDYLTALLAEVALEAGDLPCPVPATGDDIVVEAPITRFFWRKALAIAAAITLVATLFFFVGKNSGPATPPVLATITDANELAEQSDLRIGQPLGHRTIHLPENAEIGIAMRGGARLKLNGPIEMEILSEDKVDLKKGRISTYAPSYARGFTVDTEDGQVIDLGTRFVTATGTDAGTEIHVTDGLVKANYSNGRKPDLSLEKEDAAVIKNGHVKPIDYLAQRLHVPLDPVLADADGDGFPDEIESHYGTATDDAADHPVPLRVEESFANYSPGPVEGTEIVALGGQSGELWDGSGTFLAEGLDYQKNGHHLLTSGGSLRTIGASFAGAIFFPADNELPPAGVTYLSFLVRLSENPPSEAFAGFLLYEVDVEEFFAGKLAPHEAFGARMQLSNDHDAFPIPMDAATHLYVVKIDRTRRVTDIYVDPVPGEPESSARHYFRYQAVPAFDRISLRSGCPRGLFPAQFDEIRFGLTWDSVVPAKN